MRVAITGGSGLIGSALARSLRRDGHEVTAIRRGEPNAPGVDWAPDAGWIRDGAFTGIDAVVHLSGASIGEGRWSEQQRAELRDSRLQSTRLLAGHLAALHAGQPPSPATLISASAVGYYGDRSDEVLAEDAAPGEGFLADLCTEWEAAAEPARAAGVRTVHLRTGVVLAADGGSLDRMLPPFRFGLGGRLGSGRQWFPWISLRDQVRAITFLLEHPAASGPVNAVAPGSVTNGEFTAALGRVLGRPTVFRVPGFALRLMFGAGPARELLLASQRVVPSALTEAGFEFEHAEVEPALRAILQGDGLQGDGTE